MIERFPVVDGLSDDQKSTAINYASLQAVLADAYNQASRGKGADRHGQNKPFEAQPMQKLIDLYGVGFALGQAGKKMQESQRLKSDHARNELLGAINYIAGAIVSMDRNESESEPED